MGEDRAWRAVAGVRMVEDEATQGGTEQAGPAAPGRPLAVVRDLVGGAVGDPLDASGPGDPAGAAAAGLRGGPAADALGGVAPDPLGSIAPGPVGAVAAPDEPGVPADDALMRAGLMLDPPEGPAEGRVMLIACGALGRELAALRRLNGWSHIDLECLPAKLHNRPERLPEALRARARVARARGYGRVMAVFGACGAGGQIAAVCAEEGVETIAGAHCFSVFAGEGVEAEPGAFHLTDFLVRQFDAMFWRGLGLDRHPELIEMLFGHYERLVYLAQSDDPRLDAAALRAALALGLRYERRFTGVGGLAEAVEGAAPGRAAAPSFRAGTAR